MKKNVSNIFLIVIIAGTFGCSAPDSKIEALTTEEIAKPEHESSAIDSSANLEIEDADGISFEVKELGNEVDSLLKDI